MSEIINDIEGLKISTKGLAPLLGISPRRVSQLVNEGMLKYVELDNKQYIFSLREAVEGYMASLKGKPTADQKQRISKLEERKLEAEISLKESQGELHQLKTQIASGKYIGLEELQMDYDKFFVVFKKFALSIPSRVAGMAASFIEPVQARALEKDLANEVTEMLRRFVLSAKPPGEK